MTTLELANNISQLYFEWSGKDVFPNYFVLYTNLLEIECGELIAVCQKFESLGGCVAILTCR